MRSRSLVALLDRKLAEHDLDNAPWLNRANH